MTNRILLAKWDMEQRLFFCMSMARGLNFRQSMELLTQEFEGIHEYTQRPVAAYRKSEQGKAEMNQAMKILREEAERRSYAHRGSRLDSLIDIAERTYSKIFALPEDQVTKYVSLCAEFRQQMETIKKEMERYETSDETAVALFDQFVKLAETARVTKIGTKKPVLEKWEPIETPSN